MEEGTRSAPQAGCVMACRDKNALDLGTQTHTTSFVASDHRFVFVISSIDPLIPLALGGPITVLLVAYHDQDDRLLRLCAIQ